MHTSKSRRPVRRVGCDRDSGSQALSVIFRPLAAPGDAVVMEAPTYPGAIAAARTAGLRDVTVLKS